MMNKGMKLITAADYRPNLPIVKPEFVSDREREMMKLSEECLIEHAELQAIENRKKPMGREVHIRWQSILIERRKA